MLYSAKPLAVGIGWSLRARIRYTADYLALNIRRNVQLVNG